jgi:hypothetical protein
VAFKKFISLNYLQSFFIPITGDTTENEFEIYLSGGRVGMKVSIKQICLILKKLLPPKKFLVF